MVHSLGNDPRLLHTDLGQLVSTSLQLRINGHISVMHILSESSKFSVLIGFLKHVSHLNILRIIYEIPGSMTAIMTDIYRLVTLRTVSPSEVCRRIQPVDSGIFLKLRCSDPHSIKLLRIRSTSCRQ